MVCICHCVTSLRQLPSGFLPNPIHLSSFSLVARNSSTCVGFERQFYMVLRNVMNQNVTVFRNVSLVGWKNGEIRVVVE